VDWGRAKASIGYRKEKCWVEPLKWPYNPFFEAKKHVFPDNPLRSERLYQKLREATDYEALFDPEKSDIDPKNTFFWDLNAE